MRLFDCTGSVLRTLHGPSVSVIEFCWESYFSLDYLGETISEDYKITVLLCTPFQSP